MMMMTDKVANRWMFFTEGKKTLRGALGDETKRKTTLRYTLLVIDQMPSGVE